MRAALAPRARALLRRYRDHAQTDGPAAGSGGLRQHAVGRHAQRHAVRNPGRSGAARNSSARRETAARQTDQAVRQADQTVRQADQAVRQLYDDHYRDLTRLAALLAGDQAAAEEIAQSAFVAMHRVSRRLGSGDAALLYLRREVVRRARNRPSGRRSAAAQPPQTPGSLAAASALAALGALSVRQREAVILRCWAGLPDAQIAAVTGTRPDAVTDNFRQALAVLAAAAQPDHDMAAGRPAARAGADSPPSGPAAT